MRVDSGYLNAMVVAQT